MKAVIKTGGKQYKVSIGDKIDVEKIDAKVGDKIKFNPICLIDGKKVEADSKKASKTIVEAKVLKQHKDDKKIVFKFKRRKNYKVKNGHRQNLTLVEIIKIGTKSAAKKTTNSKKTNSATKKQSSVKKNTNVKKTSSAENKK